jgi:hypothetical protein
MIAGYYRLRLQSPPETPYKRGGRFQGWEGGDGVMAHIVMTFDLKREDKKQVIKVLINVTEWASRGVNYKGQRVMGQGRKRLITPPQEYQILIDSMEKGYSLVTAMHQINEYLQEINLTEAGYTTTRRTMKGPGPVMRRIRRRKQGNRDPKSPWAKARLRWVTQLLVRLGNHEFDATKTENTNLELTSTPGYFDSATLPPMSLHQIVFFDECHKKRK